MINDQNPLDKVLENLQDWLLRHWSPIFITAFLASLAFFVVWLSTILVWPIEDAHRLRQEVILADDTILSVDYPQRLLIRDQPTPLFLTITSNHPVSTTIELPSSLPLVLSATEPTGTLYPKGTSYGQVVIDWPPLITTDVSSQTLPAVGSSARHVISPTIPILQNAQTISLQMSNARIRSGSVLDLIVGFSEERITFLNAKENGTVRIKVETTGRASWRAFAKDYSFIAILPILIPILGAALKIYSKRISQRRKAKAKALLSSYTEALRSGKSDRLLDIFAKMSPSLQYLSEFDQAQLVKLHRFCEKTLGVGIKETSSAETSETMDRRDFTEWPEVWVDALFLLYRRHDSSSPLYKQLYTYVRIFPKDLLSSSTRRRFQEIQHLLTVVPIQEHSWPLPANSPPKKYSVESLPNTWTIEQMDLFPYADASLDAEQRILYAKNTEWFWSRHPLYVEIVQNDSDFLVYGSPGSGKTALALALSAYALPNSERVLASYHAISTRGSDARICLANGLLHFALSHSSRLSRLGQEEQDLLSRVLLSVLDARYLLAQLERSDKINQEETASKWQPPVWLDQNAVEIESLRQSIEKLSSEKPLPPDQWLLCLGYCAKKLDFERVRIVLETIDTTWKQQGMRILREFTMPYRKNGAHIPIQLVILITNNGSNIDKSQLGVRVRELEWTTNHTGIELEMLLQHRAQRRGIIDDLWPVHLPAMTDLAIASDGSPKRMAILWKLIKNSYPRDKALTVAMVEYAKGQFRDHSPS